MSSCEWNPEKERPALEGEHHAQAVFSVGMGRNNWHLCEECSRLPIFKKLKRKDKLENIQ